MDRNKYIFIELDKLEIKYRNQIYVYPLHQVISVSVVKALNQNILISLLLGNRHVYHLQVKFIQDQKKLIRISPREKKQLAIEVTRFMDSTFEIRSKFPLWLKGLKLYVEVSKTDKQQNKALYNKMPFLKT